MSRVNIRRLRCDALVPAKVGVTDPDDSTRLIDSEVVLVPCEQIFEIASKLYWTAVEHRARVHGWRIKGPARRRTHHCPTHAKEAHHAH